MNTEIDLPAQAGSNSLPDLAARIRAEHEATISHLRQGAQHAMAAGDLLREAKALVKHGQWLPWLKENCAIAERTAQQYMRLANNRDLIERRNPHDHADLTIAGALELLAPLKSHPLKDDLIPEFTGPGFDVLVNSIKRWGFSGSPITLYEGMILDGRARYRACLKAGVEPHFEHYEGDDPVGLIVSRDLMRKHLTDDQIAMLTVEMAEIEKRIENRNGLAS